MNIKKTVLINRAVPGSGKTTYTNVIIERLNQLGITRAVHSTDSFFMVDGRYVFEVEKLNGYHRDNLANFVLSLANGVDFVVCDNVNLSPWQTEPYTQAARAHGYQIIFMAFDQA